MIPSTSRRAHILYQYYRCRSHVGGQAPCDGVSLRASEIERYLVELLGSDDLASDDQSDAQREDVHRFVGIWSGLDDFAQRRLVPEVLHEAVYDVRAGTLSVSLQSDALERVTRHPR